MTDDHNKEWLLWELRKLKMKTERIETGILTDLETKTSPAKARADTRDAVLRIVDSDEIGW